MKHDRIAVHGRVPRLGDGVADLRDGLGSGEAPLVGKVLVLQVWPSIASLHKSVKRHKTETEKLGHWIKF